MAKGEQTRQRIIERAAPVFNTHGFSGTSLADLTRATGLEKGGIYNHFASKEALALAALDYAVQQTEQRLTEALAHEQGAIKRLLAMTAAFAAQAEDPWLPGGCPIANTAVEADDALPVLRERAQAAMTSWHKLIGSTVKRGIYDGELRGDADPYDVAAVISATLEGGLMLSQLYGDGSFMRRCLAHLQAYITDLAAPGA
jgi:AcrR family transcriptional regulator